VSSTCFEQPSVPPQEDLYMHIYGISLLQDPAIDQTAYTKGTGKAVP